MVRDDALNRGYSQKDECGNATDSKACMISRQFCEYCQKRGHCPAHGKTCNAYHRPNHFASVCQAEKKEVIHHAVDQEGASDEQAFFIGAY